MLTQTCVFSLSLMLWGDCFFGWSPICWINLCFVVFFNWIESPKVKIENRCWTFALPNLRSKLGMMDPWCIQLYIKCLPNPFPSKMVHPKSKWMDGWFWMTRSISLFSTHFSQPEKQETLKPGYWLKHLEIWALKRLSFFTAHQKNGQISVVCYYNQV